MLPSTKPIVAACAMTLVEDCTLRLDDPVDEFLPELADMRVLADPDGLVAESPRGAAALYVAMTRPTQRLTMVRPAADSLV